MKSTRTVEKILPAPPQHWVGDGFPVSSVVSPDVLGQRLSPFVLFDYAGPAEFPPTDAAPGVDFHPHRGFETVTVVYQGELEHRDSSGGGGKIGPGDVQWMTAASGLLHEEKHSHEFSRRGGVLEMAQLWVNLPARHKMAPPRYQALLADAIPTFALPDDAGSVRVVAGELQGTPGPAKTFTPVLLWDVRLRAGARARLALPAGANAGFLVRRGAVWVGGSEAVRARQLAVLGNEGDALGLEAEEEAELLVLGGQPIREPIAMYGPFVMNTQEEIKSAIDDYRSGRMGRPPGEVEIGR